MYERPDTNQTYVAAYIQQDCMLEQVIITTDPQLLHHQQQQHNLQQQQHRQRQPQHQHSQRQCFNIVSPWVSPFTEEQLLSI